MIEYVWEFIVIEEYKGQFELVFGPGGAWGQVYAAAPGFRGTSMMRDLKHPSRFLIVDVWDSEAARDTAREENKTAFSELEKTLNELILSMSELGVFNLAAQANVRPTLTSKQSKPGKRR